MKRTTPLRSRTRLKAVGERGRRLAPGDRAWRAEVYERYGRWCVWPGCSFLAFDVHHIEGKQAHPELRHEISNGRPLCRKHHKFAHDYPLSARTVLQQLKETPANRG